MSPLRKFDFNDLFILEIANNHQGSVEHGLTIIRELEKVVEGAGVRAAVKLQFRDLDTFIHKDAQKKNDNKHVQRFLSTRLTRKEFKTLVDATKKAGMITIATPSDEASIDLLEELKVEVIKISSASATDWPLLEKAVTLGKPMVVSIGGMAMPQVDRLVSFLDHRSAHFALMHCVSIYPTPMEKLNLRHIEVLKRSYPHVPIGFSTHEDPENMSAVQIAYAKGARIFERHVGVPTKTISLNSYSSTPAQVARWFAAWHMAKVAEGHEREYDPREQADLDLQRRGVFAKRPLKKDQKVKRTDVYFAFPYRVGQLSSGEFREGSVVADRAYRADEPVAHEARDFTPTERDLVYHPIHEVKAMLNVAGIPLPPDFLVEFSHPHGLQHFRTIGVVSIECIHRDYSKKILVQLPGQEYPHSHHLKKEKTFQVLHGLLAIELEKRRMTLHPGDSVVIQRGVKHRFWTDIGAIVEEVSGKQYTDDVFYDDVTVQSVAPEKRLTTLTNWGRHHFD